MDFFDRLIIVILVIAVTLFLSRWVPKHPRWRPLVVALNLLVTGRYLWWRATQTLNWESNLGIAVSLTLYAAEIYGFLLVLHHYLIATRRTEYDIAPPDADYSPWVDVLVSTYNEDNDILYRTIVGCKAMDYPNKKIWVLDDGRRREVEKLCNDLGVNYLSRENNEGAKAGNLNNALRHSESELIVTFDADHVPVRTFLNETVGFFRDEKVAQVQTPNHFYNPDLFQDRLRIREYIANEQDMFYHVVQPGRDVYNSSFYCGSSALFRRQALEDVGGFPQQTITEDLHTSILLHDAGWKTRYLNRDLSAGLAPETYEAYVTQRRRWARGTLQVMFSQRALFKSGLSLMQRINYFATLWYWMYGFPRIIYLMAPLFFLLLGLRPLVIGDLSHLLTYYIPHLAVSIVAFQLVNKSMRRIFWSDVYESCISVHIALTTLAFPFSRAKPRFEVTPKGRAAGNTGRRLAWPVLLMGALMVAGLVVGTARLIGGGIQQDGLLINTTWAAYNLVILALGLLLLKNRPRRRASVRLPRRLTAILAWNGTQAEAQTIDISETGASFVLQRTQALPDYLDITVSGSAGTGTTLRSRLVRCDVNRNGEMVAAVDFVDRTENQHRRLVELMFSDPESWSGPHGRVMGAPEHFVRILRSAWAIFSPERRLRRLAPRFECELEAHLLPEEGESVEGRLVDISTRGAALRLSADKPLPAPEEFRLRVSWNSVERSTLVARIRDVRPGTGGDRVLGLVFVDLLASQKDDLHKQLYGQRAPLRKVS